MHHMMIMMTTVTQNVTEQVHMMTTMSQDRAAPGLAGVERLYSLTHTAADTTIKSLATTVTAHHVTTATQTFLREMTPTTVAAVATAPTQAAVTAIIGTSIVTLTARDVIETARLFPVGWSISVYISKFSCGLAVALTDCLRSYLGQVSCYVLAIHHDVVSNVSCLMAVHCSQYILTECAFIGSLLS
ncbi:hypothetical protein BaRGS_00036029 [Batillaria attramentaria]|uniref:Uncharacterized protein n=1 Tax=Batillaria attramentaria TaxID=370345 RepID=A0ABD0JCV6_9CAEN